MTDGVKILEVRELIPQVKRKPQENLMANSRINNSVRKKAIADTDGYFYC